MSKKELYPKNLGVSSPPLSLRKILIVDDDELIAATLRLTLPAGWTLVECSTANEALARPDLSEFLAVFIDIHLSGDLQKTEGLEVIKNILILAPELDCIAMSGDLNRDLMERGLHAGAKRFLAKPIVREEFLQILDKSEALYEIKEARSFHQTLGQPPGHPFGHLFRHPIWIGSSPQSKKILEQIAALKSERGPILLEGDSGTGKEVIAWLLHHQESPKGRPFIRVNLGAIPESVFESEFFGYVKGAFTGADQNRAGLAEAAHGGELFLDEIEALPLPHQAKLLRFLESGEVRRVGSQQATHVQARVIVATNRNLQEMVHKKTFREDLLWRINGKTVYLPKLSERKADIPELATYFLSLERPRHNKTFSEEALQFLSNLPFPGNTRELKRLCEQACLYAPLPVIRVEDLRKCIAPNSLATSQLPVNPLNPDAKNLEIDFSQGLNQLIAQYEAYLLKEAIKAFREPDLAAEKIGISRSSMYKKMKDYSIERP